MECMAETRNFGDGSALRGFVARMRETADLTAIVGERVRLQKRGANYFGLCPFHSEKTPSFSVNPAKGFYHCFGCGANGDALSFVIQTEAGGDFMTGVESLAARLGMTVPRRGDSDVGDAVAKAIADAHSYFRRELSRSDEAREYLQKRGINDDTIARYEIGFAPPGWGNLAAALHNAHKNDILIRAGLLRTNHARRAYDYFRNRIMFPIMEGAGRVVGFGGRALGEDDPAKYLNSPDTPLFSKKNVVFGVPQAREAARDKKRVVVVEGYMDAVMLSQHGFAESVAVMGTALTMRQAKKLARMADNLVFAFDGDEAGQKAAWRGAGNILPALSDGIGASFLFLPQGEDPDSFVGKNGAAEMERALRGAISLGDYLARQLRLQAGAQTPEGRASWILSAGEKMARLLDSERAPFLREVLTQKFSEAAGVSAEAVRRAAARSAPKKNVGSNARYKMRDSGLLFNLLCCLASRPLLLAAFSENPPLPGDETESAIVADMLNFARRRLDEGDESPDISAHLAAEGYNILARQVKDTVRQRYAKAANPAAEFAAFAERLERMQKRHDRRRELYAAFAEEKSDS